MGGCKENGSIGKGLEKLFRRWDSRGEAAAQPLDSPIPYLPPVSDADALGGGNTMWGREIRLMVLLCLSIAMLCLHGWLLGSTAPTGKVELPSHKTAR